MKNFSLSVLSIVAVLLGCELLARMIGGVGEDSASTQAAAVEDWLVPSRELGWERKPGFRGPVGLADREFDGAGYFTADSRQVAITPPTRKVVFAGDSNTFGFGVPTEASFVEVAESLLPDVAAINLGVVGYSSYQGRVLLEKQLPVLKPDLVVVSFNFNDRRYVLQPGAVDGPAEFGRAWQASQSGLAAVAASLEVSHFYRGLRRLMAKAGLLPGGVTTVNVRELAPRVDAEAYRRNLSAIAAEARRLGIPVLFLLLRDDPAQTDHLRKGIASLARGDYETAISQLNFTAGSPGMFADLARVYLARAHEAAGNPAKAAEAAVSPSAYRSFSGGTVIRLDTDYNDIMRQVAAEQGVTLVDAAKVLEEQPSAFIDFCHFNADGHRRVGELLASRIAEILSRRHARMPAPGSADARVVALASPR